MQYEHFEQSPAGRLLRVGQGEAAYWAFCPHPLPPPLTPDLPLMKTLSMADRALGELAGLGRTVSNPQLLMRPFVRREAVLSSRIEGTQADLADVYAYEAGQLPLPGLHSSTPESDVREVVNYVTALEYGLERLQTLPVSLRLLRELHERLMSGVRGEKMTPGEFRRSQNWIGPPGVLLKNAVYVPPPVEEMQQALYALETYLHSGNEYPPLIRLGLIHYQFEAIHPFLDGNGRIGRLLISLLLVHWKLLPLPLLYLSAYFERHRQQYYDLLLSVSQRGAWHAWLHFFLTGVAEQAQDAVARARHLQELRQTWQIQLQVERASGLLYQIVDLLFERPIISANDVMQRHGVVHQTSRRALQRLAELGLVREVSGRQRYQQYVAESILGIVS